MKRPFKILIALLIFFGIFFGTLLILTMLTSSDKAVFPAVILTVAILTVGIIRGIRANKISTCLIMPLLLASLLVALIVLELGIDFKVLLIGSVIGVSAGFTGTIWKWARKPTN